MKSIYFFGNNLAEGKANMKNLLGGKGANLAEMTNMGIPVPAGLTITTDVCTYYYENNYLFPDDLESKLKSAIGKIESAMGKSFGDVNDPLLLSVRSGARQSMPGMMETVLNVGLTSETIPGLIVKTDNPRFVYDAYRRLIMMYSDVVMEKAAGIEPDEGHGIRHQLESILNAYKIEKGYSSDIDLTAEDWSKLSGAFKSRIKNVLGSNFPDDPYEQLWGGIKAVFQSWNGKRAISYRRIEKIPDEWGTAVNVQAMVFGNTGDRSATGVAFTRNPATGENKFYGEWLQNAQGEDVVAGIRTPHPLNEATRTDASAGLESLETFLPDVYSQLDSIRTNLERHYADMQDIEFTIENGNLWMLQTRTGKRTGTAAIKMTVDMVAEAMISKEEGITRVSPNQIDELLHPRLDIEEEKSAPVIAKGLPAGPGGGVGRVVFTADDAETWAKDGKKVILVREETSPEDVHGMHAAEAILTAKGGMTSHAALVARGWGKCCIVGCSALNIDFGKKAMDVNGEKIKEGDWISMNGTKGTIYLDQLILQPADPEANESYRELMAWADEIRTLKVRTNADSPEDSKQAIAFGAEGIGLCRTEHMFFDPQRITAMRKMILAENRSERRNAVMELLPFQREDFKGIFEAMAGKPVTIRLLDPPLHEFITLNDEQVSELATELGVPPAKINSRINSLHELNPMLGHRGCRLGVAYPEITEMQARAIFEATAELNNVGVEAMPEVMIPLIGTHTEFENQEKIVRRIAEDVMMEKKIQFDYLVGTMIELPRACLTADEVAQRAEFFSFGTNDLTQTTYGFSRDDIGGFLPDYLENNILTHDPFQSLDQIGVGQLVRMAVEKGRKVKKDLKIGICGEHGGDPDSVEFCHQNGLDYVSCSPFRVPVARLAAAHAALKAFDKRYI
ncbi:MAG: pyruvate, phosphate dikinase [Candidatus Marinimicrobia bacterium]|nr:pyruvate, phosphate dikinase [Candidatus Neomarinimicrobiota bacterium]